MQQICFPLRELMKPTCRGKEKGRGWKIKAKGGRERRWR